MNTSIRKHVAAFALCLIATFAAMAQVKDATFLSNGYAFPSLSMDKLASYCETDSTTFDSIMRSLGFTIEENIYTKGDLDKSKMVFGKSHDFGTSIVWISNDTKISIIDMILVKTALPKYISVADGFSFMYRKFIITVKSTQNGVRYEEINIIEKTKYNDNQIN